MTTTEQLNIYSALHKAADMLEANPSLWDFWNVEVPPCGSPGCAIGLLGSLLGQSGKFVETACRECLGVDASLFYERMRVLASRASRDYWCDSAETVAPTMRDYAEKYHAPMHLPVPFTETPMFAAIVEAGKREAA